MKTLSGISYLAWEKGSTRAALNLLALFLQHECVKVLVLLSERDSGDSDPELIYFWLGLFNLFGFHIANQVVPA